MSKKLTLLGALAAALVVASSVLAATSGQGARQGIVQPNAPTVYATKLTCCRQIVLGPQSKPTLIMKSSALPIGTYLVNATVGLVMGPGDNVVCGASLASNGQGGGLFGSAGNGARDSGQGAGGVYGAAVMFDTIKVTKPGDRFQIVCNSGHYGNGTYASSAAVFAERLGTVIQG